MAKRDDAASSPASGTRLVYSTGGEATAPLAAKSAAPRPKAAPRPAAPGGGGKGIRVRLEKRPGGREITTVLGVPGNPEAVAALARDLRAACGAGGTVRDGVIELQGDQCEKVRVVLSERGMKSR